MNSHEVLEDEEIGVNTKLEQFEQELLNAFEDCLTTDPWLNGLDARDEAQRVLKEFHPLIDNLSVRPDGRSTLTTESVEEAEKLREEFPAVPILIFYESVRDWLPK